MTRQTIKEVLPNGVLSVMNENFSDLVTQLFTEQQVKDFDFGFLGLHGSRKVSVLLDGVEGEQVNGACDYVLSKYFDSWKREKEALEAEYDLLWTGGGDNTTTETRHEQGTNKDSENVQNALNAFNGEEASDTDNQSRNGEGEHDVTVTLERKVERKENSVTYTQAEVVEKELALRMKYRFFDIVTQDITRELCLPIY